MKQSIKCSLDKLIKALQRPRASFRKSSRVKATHLSPGRESCEHQATSGSTQFITLYNLSKLH